MSSGPIQCWRLRKVIRVRSERRLNEVYRFDRISAIISIFGGCKHCSVAKEKARADDPVNGVSRALSPAPCKVRIKYNKIKKNETLGLESLYFL